MKSTISIPLSTLALFVPPAGARSAQDIIPYEEEGFVEIRHHSDSDSFEADERLGGAVDVRLFETEIEMEAFTAGIDIANPGDDYTYQKYESKLPIDGCKYVVVFHNCDTEPELTMAKFVNE